MSRHTITLIRTDGRKVRTAVSRRYYVTAPERSNEDKAHVWQRTDDIVAAERTARLRLAGCSPEIHVLSTERFHNGQPAKATARVLSRDEVHNLVTGEKTRRKFAERTGRQGEARRVWY
jgi:hypothetical protein